jgi:hypothetical protein
MFTICSIHECASACPKKRPPQASLKKEGIFVTIVVYLCEVTRFVSLRGLKEWKYSWPAKKVGVKDCDSL